MPADYTLSPHARELARDLLAMRVVQLDVHHPFTWVSGIRSPVYCDNRKINSDVAVRNRVADAFTEMIRARFPEVHVIAGVATGGIPFGMLVADRLELPFVYVRQAAKEHGLMKQVEGTFRPGDAVVLIEDHISTGSSSMQAVQGLIREGLKLLGLISVMTYGFASASELFAKEQIDLSSLCDLPTVLEVAEQSGSLNTADRASIQTFLADPKGWMPAS